MSWLQSIKNNAGSDKYKRPPKPHFVPCNPNASGTGSDSQPQPVHASDSMIAGQCE
jgi:hypothetical protein